MRFIRRVPKKGRVELIPLIDTMLMLLIFYMSFSTFAEMELEYGVKVPAADESGKWKKSPDQLIINIPSAGEILISKEKYDLDSLERLLNNLVRSNSKINVVIRGDKNLYYKEISKILSICSRNSIWNITFATLEGE
ncbi:MAG: biopolymer transporter ExbD [Candidatus Firestonebacteria bacterium]